MSTFALKKENCTKHSGVHSLDTTKNHDVMFQLNLRISKIYIYDMLHFEIDIVDG